MKGLARFWLGSFVTKNKEIFSIIFFIHGFLYYLYIGQSLATKLVVVLGYKLTQ